MKSLKLLVVTSSIAMLIAVSACSTPRAVPPDKANSPYGINLIEWDTIDNMGYFWIGGLIENTGTKTRKVRIKFDIYNHQGHYLVTEYNYGDIPAGKTWKFHIPTLLKYVDVGEAKPIELVVVRVKK